MKIIDNSLEIIDNSLKLKKGNIKTILFKKSKIHLRGGGD